MITVNESAPPEPGQFNHYGSDYQVQISAKTARHLCGMYPIPEMGHETVVALNANPAIGKPRLYVANISGTYFVRSHAVSVDDWPEVFRVIVKRKEAVK